MTDGDSITNDLTPLERAVLDEYFSRYEDVGIPSADAFKVVARDNTGAGRFTHFMHPGIVSIPDGTLPLGRFSQIDLNGLPAGASFWLKVESGTIRHLEIVVNGDQDWNGEETFWSILNPDSAEGFIRRS